MSAAMTTRKCLCCSKTFEARTADVARGWAKYCSKRCKAIKQEARTGQYADCQSAIGRDNDAEPSFSNAHQFSNTEFDR